MATTVAVIVVIEILSIAAGIAIGRILWSDWSSASPPAPTVATAAPANPGNATTEPTETSNSLEAVSEQLQSLAHQPTAETPAPNEKPPAQSMLEVKASFDSDINAAYAAINDKYLDEVKRLCDELLDRADGLRGTGTEDFELEQLQSQVETSMNNLTLLNLGTSEHDVCKTIESEVSKICSQIERVKV